VWDGADGLAAQAKGVGMRMFKIFPKEGEISFFRFLELFDLAPTEVDLSIELAQVTAEPASYLVVVSDSAAVKLISNSACAVEGPFDDVELVDAGQKRQRLQNHTKNPDNKRSVATRVRQERSRVI
jgi:hypothetical protein